MQHQQLHQILENLNQHAQVPGLFLTPISAKVSLALYWDEIPTAGKPRQISNGPYTMYVVKQSAGIFSSIVLDMRQDLHWYTLPEYRGKGYLSGALKETILPHLFLERKEQLVSISPSYSSTEEFTSSRKLAESCGFLEVSNTEGLIEYKLERKKFRLQSESKVKQVCPGLPLERIEELQQEVKFLANSVWLLGSEIKMAYHDKPFDRKVMRLVDQLKALRLPLEDIYYDHLR